MSRYQFIDQQRASYPVRLLCRVLGVTPGCYYAWSAQQANPPRPARDTTWETALVQVFTRHKQRYGTRRLQAELQAQGYRVGRQRLRAARSQSRRGECLDNAQAESLWSRLKTEELEQREWPVFRDLADAQHSVATYFDYYNYEHRHSALAYQTPQAFYLQQLKTATLNCLA